MEPNIIFGIINIACALLIIGISIPLVKHKIKMNYLYGIRIKKSFESEDSWYKINEYGGKQLIIWSIPMILVGLICFFVQIDDTNKDLLSFVFGVFPITACIAVAVIKIYAYAKRI
jgi:uncharacterized membrane protein